VWNLRSLPVSSTPRSTLEGARSRPRATMVPSRSTVRSLVPLSVRSCATTTRVERSIPTISARPTWCRVECRGEGHRRRSENSHEVVGTGVEQSAIDDRVVDEIEKLRITRHTRAARIPSSREHRFGNWVASHDDLVDTLLEVVVGSSGVSPRASTIPSPFLSSRDPIRRRGFRKRPGTVL